MMEREGGRDDGEGGGFRNVHTPGSKSGSDYCTHRLRCSQKIQPPPPPLQPSRGARGVASP